MGGGGGGGKLIFKESTMETSNSDEADGVKGIETTYPSSNTSKIPTWSLARVG